MSSYFFVYLFFVIIMSIEIVSIIIYIMTDLGFTTTILWMWHQNHTTPIILNYNQKPHPRLNPRDLWVNVPVFRSSRYTIWLCDHLKPLPAMSHSCRSQYNLKGIHLYHMMTFDCKWCVTCPWPFSHPIPLLFHQHHMKQSYLPNHTIIWNTFKEKVTWLTEFKCP